MTQHYRLIQNGKLVMKSDEFTIREKIEEMLEEKTGIFVSLQENTDDGYHFYLHSEASDDMSDTEWDTLTKQYGIGDNDEAAETAILSLLDIRVIDAILTSDTSPMVRSSHIDLSVRREYPGQIQQQQLDLIHEMGGYTS